MEEQAHAIQKTLFEIDGTSSMISAQQSDQRNTMDMVQKNTSDFAERLAQTSQFMETILTLVQNALHTSYRGGALGQENSWKMESLRENTQSTSKRIKRLGESTQSIGVSTDLIKEISRRIKVLALYVAVEAAAQGEAGRNFTLLARELERLAQNTDQAVKDIDLQTTAIQTDAKETVVSMEEGTADVVDSGKLSTALGAVFKDIDRGLERIKADLSQSITKIEECSLGVGQESEAAGTVQESLEVQSNQINSTRDRSNVFRSSVTEIKKWLSGIGKNI